MEFFDCDTYQVNDITLNCYPCAHCGEKCSEAQAMQAVAFYKRTSSPDCCVVCGLEVVPQSWSIRHVADQKGKTWSATPTEPRTGIILSHPNEDSGIEGVLHVDCAKRALPHLPAVFWNTPRRSWYRMWPVDPEHL